jgi:hypothetical protein
VVLQQLQRNDLKRAARRCELREDVDPVPVLLHHPRQAKDLPFDAVQPDKQSGLRIAGHAAPRCTGFDTCSTPTAASGTATR